MYLNTVLAIIIVLIIIIFLIPVIGLTTFMGENGFLAASISGAIVFGFWSLVAYRLYYCGPPSVVENKTNL